jgi:hypothetical protein
MGAAAILGTAVSFARSAALGLAAVALSASAAAGDNYALVISGASSGEPYAGKYTAWRQSFVSTLRTKFGYPDDHVVVMGEASGAGVRIATRDEVRKAVLELRARLTASDQLVVLLIGHGTAADGGEEDARFNLVGPDLKASEWGELLKPVTARVVFVDTTAVSFPFLRHLALHGPPGRIVITATESTAQEFETVFGEFFVRAFADASADGDKNGRVSVFEAFTYATNATRSWYEQRGQLPTEHPLIEDESGLARTTFLQPAAVPDGVPSTVLQRQRELETQIDELKRRRSTMSPAAYDAELERLLIELARLSRR